MPKLKVLPPEWWMLTDHWLTDELRIDRASRRKKVKPVYLRPGIYLEGDRCWFENGTRAWFYESKQFRYTLDILDAEQVSANQVKALHGIVDAKLATKQQKRLLQLCLQVESLRANQRSIGVHALRSRKRLKQLKESRCISSTSLATQVG